MRNRFGISNENANLPKLELLKVSIQLQGEKNERTCFSKGVKVDHAFGGIKRVEES